MVNWKSTIQKNDIPIDVNYLKHLMADCLPQLNDTHYLKNLLSLFETWHQKGMPDPIPNDVIELAHHAKSLKSFRSDYNDSRTKNHLVTKLCDENMVHSILYEFRSCIHFDYHHKSVSWLPNIGNISESDLRIVHRDGSIFYIECSSKNPKTKRMTDYDIVKRDVLLTVRKKRKQSNQLVYPRVISIFFPEDINLDDMPFRKKLGKVIQDKFKDPSYNTVAAVCIVSNNPPKFIKKNNGFEYYDTNFGSLSYPNPNSTFKLKPKSINSNGLF